MSTTAKKGHQISGSGGASKCDLCFASVYLPPLHSKLADRKIFALLSLPLQQHFCCCSSSQWSSPLSSSLSSRYVAAPVKCVLFACLVAVCDPPLHTRAGRQRPYCRYFVVTTKLTPRAGVEGDDDDTGDNYDDSNQHDDDDSRHQQSGIYLFICLFCL